MKCRIYLQDDVMNHITGPVNQRIKMDKWFHKVMHLWIWGGETRTHSDISHIRKKKNCYLEINPGIKLDDWLLENFHVLLSQGPWIPSWPPLASCSNWELCFQPASPNQQLQTQLHPYTCKPSPRAPAASVGKAGNHRDVWQLDRTARATGYSCLRFVVCFFFN